MRLTRSVSITGILFLLGAQRVNPQTFINPALIRTQPSSDMRISSPGHDLAKQAIFHVTSAGAQAEVDRWIAAETFARSSFGDFANAVRLRESDQATADRLIRLNDPAAVSAGLAAVALNPVDAVLALEGLDEASANRVRRAQRSLRAAVDEVRQERKGRQLMVFADGTIRGALSDDEGDGEDDDGPLSTGSLGASVDTHLGLWTAKVTVASTETVIADDFGSAVLSPGTGRSLASGLIDLRFGDFPVHLYGSASSSRWKLTEGDDAPATRATVLGLGGLFHRNIALGTVGENDVSITAEAGLAGRWLDGDVRDNDKRKTVIGDPTIFAGPELGFALTFGRVTGAVQLYGLYAPGKYRHHVDGLTGLQLVAGLGVTGEFFRGRLGS